MLLHLQIPRFSYRLDDFTVMNKFSLLISAGTRFPAPTLQHPSPGHPCCTQTPHRKPTGGPLTPQTHGRVRASAGRLQTPPSPPHTRHTARACAAPPHSHGTRGWTHTHRGNRPHTLPPALHPPALGALPTPRTPPALHPTRDRDPPARLQPPRPVPASSSSKLFMQGK